MTPRHLSEPVATYHAAGGPAAPPAEMVLDLDFGAHGNSEPYQIDGWGDPEGGFRWSVGRRSRIRLPAQQPGYIYTLVIRALPWLHAPEITRQTIMLALDDRLLDTVALHFDAALAFDLPQTASTSPIISFIHLDSDRSARIDRYADGQSMGLMMRSVRLIRRLPRRFAAPAELPPIAGTIEGGTLPARVATLTGRPVGEVLDSFDCLGGWCGLPDLQDRFGVRQLGLLRYAGLDIADLVDGLFRQFEGIGEARHVTAFNPPGHPNDWDVHESRYRIWWHTVRTSEPQNGAEIEAFECARLPFLQRKLVKSLALGKRIFVLPTAEVPAAVLAVYLALSLRGPNTLLFADQSGDAAPGTVQLLANGMLRAHMDRTPACERGTEEVWLGVLANAYRLACGVC